MLMLWNLTLIVVILTLAGLIFFNAKTIYNHVANFVLICFTILIGLGLSILALRSTISHITG